MLPSIHNLQATTAGRNGRLDFSKQGKVSVASRFTAIQNGVRRILERVGLLRQDPARANRQNKALSGLLGRIEARFNPNDLRAANVSLNNWKAEPHKLRGADLSRSLEAVTQAEAQRIADRRTAAAPWMNFAPQVDSARTSSALFERMPAGFDSWPSDQRARFQPAYRRTFEGLLEVAIRNESPDRRLGEKALTKIADQAIAVAERASQTPASYARFQTAWERHNDSAQRYVQGMLDGAPADKMQDLQRDFAKAQLAVNTLVFPGADEEQSGTYHDIRQFSSVMALRHIKSHLLDSEPKFNEKFASAMENAKSWATPLISSQLLLDVASDNRASEIVQKTVGAHCVLNLMSALFSDPEIGSDLAAPHWMGDFLVGGLASDFDARVVQWEVKATDEDLEPIALRDEQLIETLYDGDLEAYFADPTLDNAERAANLSQETEV